MISFGSLLNIVGFASDDVLIVAPCLIGAWIILGFTCLFHAGRPALRIGAFLVASLFFSALLGRLYIRHTRPQRMEGTLQLLSPPPNLAVVAKCDFDGLPLIIPPHSDISILYINEKIFRLPENRSGMSGFGNNSDRPLQWPSKEITRKMRKNKIMGFWSYSCEISNHGASNLLDVSIPIDFWFSGKGGEQNAVRHVVVVSPLDAGKSATIHLANSCPVMVNAVLRNQGSARVAGESKPRQIDISFPNRSFLDYIMMWSPDEVPFSGEVCQ